MASLINSRVLSRFLPAAEGDETISIYESLRRDVGRRPDLEAQHYAASDHRFHDDEDDNPDELLYHEDDGELPTQNPSPSSDAGPSTTSSPIVQHQRSKWFGMGMNKRVDEDEDVPDSLLLDPRDRTGSRRPPSTRPTFDKRQARDEAQWKAAQEQELHGPSTSKANRHTPRNSRTVPSGPAMRPNPQADATWLFTNANNLDVLLLEIYQYFVEHGVWSIILSRVIALLSELFVFSFAMFLTTCVDFQKIPTSKQTSEIIIPQCMKKASWLKSAALFFFIMHWLSRMASYIQDVRRLFRMHDFYHHVLGINDQDLQTTSWAHVVDGLAKVANTNIATANTTAYTRKYLDYRAPPQRLTAESVANRLMRQANYYVAMYNKDVLDFTLPLPFVGKRQFYSKSLEWCIDFCLTNFIFDEKGSIRPYCLDIKHRSSAVNTLRRRMRFAAATSIVVAPFNIMRFCVLYFFKYYTEFTRNPSKVSARSFTPYAEWKIRQFNELDHLFQKRIRQAYPFANEYLKQFPKDKTDQICRFVAFVSGAIAAVLTLATLFDPALFLDFEITPGRTAVFWLTLMVGIFGVANGALPEESDIHDPVFHLKEVLLFMGTMPSHWKQRLHSNEVRAEFSAMYQMKIVIFLEEILSLVVAPLILWRNSLHNCERVIDFFREHTVHVEGLGHQCNFAVFGFKKDPNSEDPTYLFGEHDPREEFYGTKDDKLSVSMYNFRHYYSHFTGPQRTRHAHGWHPPPAWPSVMHQAPILEEEIGTGAEGAQQRGISARRRSGLAESRHQPSQSTIYSPPRHPVGHGNRQTTPTTIYHGKRSVEGTAAPTVSESRLMAQDSDLKDFADAPGIAALESDTDNEDRDASSTANAGVLGLLYQFSKAQTEKGPGAVNI